MPKPSSQTAAGDVPAAPTQGSKRTVDGSLKSAGPVPEAPSVRTYAHKRNKSMDTHSGTRIGEVRVVASD